MAIERCKNRVGGRPICSQVGSEFRPHSVDNVRSEWRKRRAVDGSVPVARALAASLATRRRLDDPRHPAHLRGIGRGFRNKSHLQIVLGQSCLDSDRHSCPKAQIDVIPSDSRILAERRGRSRQRSRMWMTFNNLAAGIERARIQGVRKLANAATDRRNDATLLNLPPGNEAVAVGRPSDLSPKAKNLARLKAQPIDCTANQPQVVYLSELLSLFVSVRLGP